MDAAARRHRRSLIRAAIVRWEAAVRACDEVAEEAAPHDLATLAAG